MLPITESSDFKRVGDTVEGGYYDVTLFNDGDMYECSNFYAMDQAIENYLLTIPGERLFNIRFGSPLYSILFRKNDNQEEIREMIYSDVENALQISIDRSTAEIGPTDNPHILKIHFRYSTLDGAILNHEFARRFSK
jgi:phage baseplate assembly protein W